MIRFTTNLGSRFRYVERDYSTTYAYDLHDNLTALTRHGYTGTELVLTATKPTHHATLPTYGLTDSLITTYEYGSLFGVTRITNPDGLSTYYEYDDCGRLSAVYDDKRNILKKYVYRYSP